jgi:MoxR-like ATPase
MERRDHVIPEDVQAVFVAVAAHRLRPVATTSGYTLSSQTLLAILLMQVAV